MVGCEKCKGFSDRLNLISPREYRNHARQLIELVDHGTFKVLKADCPLEDLFGPQWPGDILVHELECVGCSRKFQLSADTYHGSARWAPVK
jgi:hypothetical protein